MIQASELRIGNILKFQQYKSSYEGVITSIGCGKFTFDNRETFKETSKFVWGIPLIEEWLEKCPQLEHGLNGRFWINGHNEYSIRISKTGGRLYGCGEFAITVMFLHEFQNWFKLLCGTELTFTT